MKKHKFQVQNEYGIYTVKFQISSFFLTKGEIKHPNKRDITVYVVHTEDAKVFQPPLSRLL